MATKAGWGRSWSRAQFSWLSPGTVKSGLHSGEKDGVSWEREHRQPGWGVGVHFHRDKGHRLCVRPGCRVTTSLEADLLHGSSKVNW